MGMAGGFMDPSNAWFLPFNMEPPTLGDDGGVFGGDAFNFGLPAGTPVDLAALNGHVHHNAHRASVSHSQGGMNGMEGLEGMDGGM